MMPIPNTDLDDYDILNWQLMRAVQKYFVKFKFLTARFFCLTIWFCEHKRKHKKLRNRFVRRFPPVIGGFPLRMASKAETFFLSYVTMQ